MITISSGAEGTKERVKGLKTRYLGLVFLLSLLVLGSRYQSVQCPRSLSDTSSDSLRCLRPRPSVYMYELVKREGWAVEGT